MITVGPYRTPDYPLQETKDEFEAALEIVAKNKEEFNKRQSNFREKAVTMLKLISTHQFRFIDRRSWYSRKRIFSVNPTTGRIEEFMLVGIEYQYSEIPWNDEVFNMFLKHAKECYK